MTDTLAQRLKEAATKAQGAKRIRDWTPFHALATPANILALLEEIERLRVQLAGCAIVAQDYQKGIEFLKPFGYGEQWKLVAVCRQSLDASISNTEAAERRIKELEGKHGG